MEEDSGLKAPVTRLRRRLSVEQSDDVKSPGPATPTKKRGGRLAAKPQLDLIDEIAPSPGSATKRSTRKASVKEIVEAEEKPVTPSRRSTRIKSNTSIVSETPQSYNSPRAKRAARRTSQVGSDSESSVTPVRATRRTRKDSASSVEKLEKTLASKPSNITEVIIEETESSSIKSDDTTKGNINTTEITPTRKSPRLKDKKQTEKNVRKSIDINCDKTEEINKSSNKEDSKQNKNSESKTETREGLDVASSDKPEDSSLLIIKTLDKKPRNISTNLNKSTSALDSNSLKSKRQRTKSWTITSNTQVDEGMFYSDNESVKKRFNKKHASKESKNESMHMGSGDNFKTEMDKSTLKSEHNTSVKENTQIESSFSTTKVSKGYLSPNKLNTPKSTTDSQTISPEGNKENVQNTKVKDDTNTSIYFLEKSTAVIQSTVFFEDSDTDSKGKGKVIQLNTEDQCVPVVDNKLVEDQDTETSKNDKQSRNNSAINNSNDKKLVDDSCEPMDIDETIPNNISINDFSQNNLNQTSNDLPKVQDQSVTHSLLIDNSLNKSPNKSRRKSSITISNNQNLEKTDNENKSTLILSPIKDVTSTEHNASKSPKVSNESLSKSVSSVSIVKEKALDKKLAQDYSTSTPLQHKKVQKLGMKINSSIIDTSTIESKKAQNKSRKHLSQSSKSSANTSEDDSEDEIDTSRPRNSQLDDEAEVASDDYESGDSQDEDERKYEKDNEFVEKGETLDSDDEASNDTDYEKDSFVVSSDEEDNDLLSGSGDDLSISDNDLTMSKKSKDKYNQRKLKDQKKASREMYEARHKLDTIDASVKSRKSKRQKIESSDESSAEETIAPVKRTRLRLDSTQDESLNKSNANNSKRKRLSESVCDENANTELEMTINEENVRNPDPLSVQVKLEPKTPMKDMDISTVQINENIEEVCVDNNVSVMKSSETVDPLQATMLEEDSSSISENSEIMNNYDSILKALSNDKPKKMVSLDMSLNSNKKKKQSKEPIIDQLNITNTKSPKSKSKNKRTEGHDVVDSIQSNKSQTSGHLSSNAFEDDSSSVSIDLQLLFSEDSNDFDVSQKSSKNTDAQDTEVVEDYIPLKRTPGKINIFSSERKHKSFSENSDSNKSQPLNESFKNNKRKSKGLIQEQTDNEAANNYDIQIIIDPKGTHESSDKSSLNTSTKKKNKKSNATLNEDDHSISKDNDAANDYDQKIIKDTQGTHESEDKSLNDSLNTSTIKKNKKNSITLNDSELFMLNVTNKTKEDVTPNKSKKKNKKSSETHIEEELLQATIIEDEEAPKKVKSKKNKKSLETHLEVTTNSEDAPEEIAYESTKSEKKNRKHSETHIEELSKEEIAEKSVNMSLNVSSSKKKKKNSESQNEPTLEEVTEKSINASLNENSAKKKKKKTESQNEHTSEEVAEKSTNMSLNVDSAKKKKKKTESQNEHTSEEIAEKSMDTSLNVNSAKKKKKNSENEHTSEEIAEKSMNMSLNVNSAKKKKKTSESQNEHTSAINDSTPSIDTNVSVGSAKKQKFANNSHIDVIEDEKESAEKSIDFSVNADMTKKKKNKKLSLTLENEYVETNVTNEEITEKSKKRKRKSSSNQDKDNVNFEDQIPNTLDGSIISGSQKKKIKISQKEENDVHISDANKMTNKGKEIKSQSFTVSEHPKENQETEHKKKNKKRKERDNDDANKISKIFKENSFDNLHVSRLPTHLIKQLDDKPKKEILEMKKSSVVSTTSFVVQDTRKRRNKPSTFLEESVYLNDTYIEKKKKAIIKKPKVLPFIPTAVTSGSGFTTNFKINVIPQEVQFVAQTKNVANFKNEYLYGKKIKRLGTYETYKKQRSAKMSKF